LVTHNTTQINPKLEIGVKMKFAVRNSYTNNIQFTAEIDCDVSKSFFFKLGLAAKWALKFRAYLKGANLEGAYLKGANLEGANLEGAYLKGAYLKGANLEGANLKWAYLKGANLEGANLKGANLEGANLEGANLEGANLEGAYLEGANLEGANLKGAYLEGANLKWANLEGADLEGANLKGADLNVPFIKDINKKVYEVTDQEGNCLNMAQWHSCETTHCHAGWVIIIAGEEGLKLEKRIGTAAAAYAIYWKSDPEMKMVPDFYCDNQTAMADIKKRAGVK